MNNIELELRAEISPDKIEKILLELKNKYTLLYETKRLSVMFLGEINNSEFDIRLRINSNKKAELVIKKGFFHSHDRIETSQLVEKDQFLGLVKMFSLFGFKSKITERENFVFDLEGGIELTLVIAGSISYVEIEKMSNNDNLEENRKKLIEIVDKMGLQLIKDSADFNELCDRLTKFSDIEYNGSDNDLKKIEQFLGFY
jgi:hypothetical protein